jgi:tRNA A-37 threonylcarbamoyl transferase component Bud32
MPDDASTLPRVESDPDATLAPTMVAESDPDATLAPTMSIPGHASGDGLAPPGYAILGELGRGGMGVVYKARQIKANRLVALKMILAGGHADADERQRFRTEGEAVARLQHRGIVQVFEIGEHDGRAFFSLEFCPGGSLDRKLGGMPLLPTVAAVLIQQLAQAMHAAHLASVVHRDLKPANILLAADGSPKVTDFGLAKKLDETGQTATGSIMGTPSYMSPEQAAGKKEVGPRTDVYALGAILYECLTGAPPSRAATALDTMQMVLTAEPVTIRRLNKKMPADIETIAMKCLEKQPEKRYASAAALADDLGRFLAGEPIAARPVGTAERAWRWCRRNPVVLLLGLLWLLVLSFLLAVRSGVDEHLASTRTVGHDTAPSILAARKIEAALADMHGNAANVLLHRPGHAKQSDAEYERRRLEATEGILEATGNVTFGEAEKGPLRRLLNGLGSYEGAVAQAVILHQRDDRAGAIAHYLRADEIVRSRLIPAADDLGGINTDALDRTYASLRTNSRMALAGVLIAGLALLGVFVTTQRVLFRRTGRGVNLGLAAGTLVTAGFLVYSSAVLAGQEGKLKRAKRDAFDSLHHLWQVRALANDANGDESRRLLDRPRAAVYEKAFRDKMARIARWPASLSEEALLDGAARGELPDGFEGYLADELGNVTYPGEREAAVLTLKRFLRYMAIERNLLALEAEGRHGEAVRLCLGEGADESNGAFDLFDAALVSAIAINQEEFDLTIASSTGELSRVQSLAPLAALAVALLAFFGLLPRLGEHPVL